MGEAAVKVPAEWVPYFREAVIREIEIGAKGVVDDGIAVKQYIAEGSGAADFQSRGRLVNADLALLDQLPNGDDAEVRSDPDTLAHVCAAMANVLAPKVAQEVNTEPLDAHGAAEARKVLVPLTWAVDEAERLFTEWERQNHESRSNGGESR